MNHDPFMMNAEQFKNQAFDEKAAELKLELKITREIRKTIEKGDLQLETGHNQEAKQTYTYLKEIISKNLSVIGADEVIRIGLLADQSLKFIDKLDKM